MEDGMTRGITEADGTVVMILGTMADTGDGTVLITLIMQDGTEAGTLTGDITTVRNTALVI